jgi:NADH-quinone oxidoreductase subunit J
MEFKTILFYVFAAILVLSALRVITARNPVHCALFLVLTFCSASGIWFLLQAEFLAIVLVLVYIGAVMVLFLFVVMMLDINIDKIREGFWGNFPVALLVGGLMVLEMSAILISSFWGIEQSQVPASSAMIGDTKELGKVIFTQYIYAFEIAAVILLVALIAATVLTLRRRKDVKHFSPSVAVKVKRDDRIRLVSMQAEPRIGSKGETPDAEQQS